MPSAEITYRFDKEFPIAGWVALFHESGYNAWWTERNAQAAKDHAYLIVTAWDGDKAVGTLTVKSDGANEAGLDDLVVHPDYHHCGIGSTLVRGALKRLEPLNLHLVQVQPIPGRESFFARLGFVVQPNATVMDLSRKQGE